MTGTWGEQVAESYSVRLVTARGGDQGALEGVTGGSLSWTPFREVRASGSLSLVDVGQSVDWLRQQVRIDYAAEWSDGFRASTPIAVMVPTQVTTRRTTSGRAIEVQLLDRVTIVLQQRAPTAVSCEAGVTVTAAVRSQLSAVGMPLVAITDSPESLRTAMSWEAGTSRLTIINDLLAAIGYAPLWADRLGQLRAESYLPPEKRPEVWRFDSGGPLVVSREIEDDLDLHAIPNRLVVRTEGTDQVAGLVSAPATDEDPESPLSYPSRGRWIDAEVETVEATSQAVLDRLAVERLRIAQRATIRQTIHHMSVPVLGMHDVVVGPDGQRTSVVGRDLRWSQSDVPQLVATTLRRITIPTREDLPW